MACVQNVLKRLSRRRLWKHNGKAVVIIDSTAHAKARSRGKIRPMPGAGKVRLHNLPTNDTLLVPGYQEVWLGLLLSDKTVLPIKRKLWSEKGKNPASLNLTEEAAIRQACDMVREIFKIDVILVADSGFRRKDLLHDLKRIEQVDFVIRLEGKARTIGTDVSGDDVSNGKLCGFDGDCAAVFMALGNRNVLLTFKMDSRLRPGGSSPVGKPSTDCSWHTWPI